MARTRTNQSVSYELVRASQAYCQIFEVIQMRNSNVVSCRLFAALALLAISQFVQAGQLPGYGQLSGAVSGSEAGVLPVVYAYNTDMDVGYTVFVVNGNYRAVNLIPGAYDVTIRPAVDQLEGFTAETQQMSVAADENVTADFELQNVGPVPNYVGGYPAEVCARGVPDCGAEIAPYDEVYPPGRGREIIENTCLGCHHVQYFPYNRIRGYQGGRAPKDKAAWTITVDRMHKRLPGAPAGRASYFKTELLPPEDRDIVIEYLAENFGLLAPPRLVQMRNEAELDLDALEKAQFIEYLYHEDPEKYPTWGWSHNLTFDGDGNVWNAYTSCCVIRTDPRTGEAKAFEDNGGGSNIVVDQSDGTVWYSGDITRANGGGSSPGKPMATMKHLDPETGLVDYWLGFPSNTQIFDSKGDLWMTAGGIQKWDRKTNSMARWKVPVLRSSPYGIIVDSKDKLWFGDHYNSGVTKFDPITEEFTFFRLTDEEPTNIRRLGIDSKDMIWTGTWASPGREVDGRNLGGWVFRLNPETGDVMERRLGIPYSTPYKAEADPFDNIWIATDNYMSKYDQVADEFTHYPTPTRSDTLKTAITREGVVWFVYRNAGKFGGYGATSVALYPDKDSMTTLAAYHHEDSVNFRSSKYTGPKSPKVTGALKSTMTPRNAVEYEEWAIEAGLAGPDYKAPEKFENPQDKDGDRY
jgi:streptogramin lyase